MVVAGVRLPFSLTSTIYADELAVDLQRLAITGLLTQTALPKELVDYVVCGNVIQEVRTSNIAREAAINAGLPVTTGAHTVAQACISANAAICTAAEKIMLGKADVIIAGGSETFSDVPIRLSRKLRQTLITAPKAMKQGNPLISGVRHVLKQKMGMRDFSLETPAIANYTTGEVMGVSSDKLSAKFGISRLDQDRYTLRSHQMAQAAHDSGFYVNEVIPYKGSTKENGIKGDSKLESIQKLKPAFVKPYGTHTAANSSYLTDGAAATLIMSESKAKELGFVPLAYIRDWSFKACDPFEELLLGPTYCTHELLTRNKLTLDDMDVLEIHEAFAGQILSNFAAMNSDKFAQEKLNSSTKIGEVKMERLNTKGGSLAIGHPFGATGSRLVTTASRRLQQEDNARFALLAACADGGMGHACLLERYDA